MWWKESWSFDRASQFFDIFPLSHRVGQWHLICLRNLLRRIEELRSNYPVRVLSSTQWLKQPYATYQVLFSNSSHFSSSLLIESNKTNYASLSIFGKLENHLIEKCQIALEICCCLYKIAFFGSRFSFIYIESQIKGKCWMPEVEQPIKNLHIIECVDNKDTVVSRGSLMNK